MHDIDTAPFNYTVNSCSDNLTVKYRRILKTTDGKDTYPMAANKKWHDWEVVIPADVTCNHCILQVNISIRILPNLTEKGSKGT